MLESAESEMVRLISREIIFAEFQPTLSRYLNVTDRRTDGQLALAIPRSARLRTVKTRSELPGASIPIYRWRQMRHGQFFLGGNEKV